MRHEGTPPFRLPGLVRGAIAQQQLRTGEALRVTQDEQIQDLAGIDYLNNEDKAIVVNSAGNGLDTTDVEAPVPLGTNSQYWRGDKTWQELPEAVQDIVGAFIAAGTGISVSYNDVANTFTISTSVTAYTDEMAQDAVGAILTDTSTIDFTYNDGAGTITADVKNDSITFDKFQNIATGRVLGRTGAGIGNVEELATTGTGNVAFSNNPTFTGTISIGAAGATSSVYAAGGVRGSGFDPTGWAGLGGELLVFGGEVNLNSYNRTSSAFGVLNIQGSQIKLFVNGGLPGNHVDDAAAAVAGVPVNGVYRTGSALKIRAA